MWHTYTPTDMAACSDDEYQSADEGDIAGRLEKINVSDGTQSQHSEEKTKEETRSSMKEPNVTEERGNTDEGNFVAGLDNRYVCESANVTQEGKVELTEEQRKVGYDALLHVHMHVFLIGNERASD